MKNFFNFLLVAIVILTVTSTFLYSSVKVGEELIEKYETLHPYKCLKGVVWQHKFIWPDASYIAIHFSVFNIAIGDYVEISSPDRRYVYKYERNGKLLHESNTQISKFWATHIPGDTAVVKLYGNGKSSGWGFTIDKWAHGYERQYVDALIDGLEYDAGIESICGSDDKEWSKCYDGTTMYNKSKTVARLLINGTTACTGWLLGSEGHLLTNNHCIESQSDADNTDYEFMAEGATCATNCYGWGDCPGTVVASSAALVKNNSQLDYALVLLPANVTSQYGYLTLRSTLPICGERIYIPQHPCAQGKQIAVNSDVEDGYCEIQSTNEVPCHGGPGDIGYYADTEGGSSGSPVIAYSDNLVVALHHCSDCLNRGVPIPSIILDLGADLPNCAVPQAPGAHFTYDNTCILVGGTVNFTDASTNCPTSWEWTFPGGTPSSSSVQNSTVTYNEVGTFDVSLTASNSSGTDSRIEPRLICVYDFSPRFNYTTNGLTVAFADCSTASNAIIKNWNWDFGDGEFSTLQNPTHTYAAGGTYSVTLTVVGPPLENTTCAISSKSIGPISITVPVINPEFQADFTYRATDLTATFTDKSTAINTTIKNWHWNFGDGAASTLKNPVHTYTSAGIYTVILTISNGSSVSNSVTKSVSILCYCANTTANSSIEWIAGVYQGNYPYKKSGGTGYANYTNIIFTLYRSGPINGNYLILKPGYSGSKRTEYWKICIDLNHNGLFTDPYETVYTGSGTGVKLAYFSIPYSALTGNTRMRVLMQYNAQPGPCAGLTYGEVEDYTVHIN